MEEKRERKRPAFFTEEFASLYNQEPPAKKAKSIKEEEPREGMQLRKRPQRPAADQGPKPKGKGKEREDPKGKGKAKEKEKEKEKPKGKAKGKQKPAKRKPAP